jgi:hypothetical protein
MRAGAMTNLGSIEDQGRKTFMIEHSYAKKKNSLIP